MLATSHPYIDRLAAIGCEELTVDNVMEVLRRRRKFIRSLIHEGDLEAIKERARSGKARCTASPVSNMTRHQYIITTAAVLRYLVKHSTGDKTVLLSAIKARFPQHLHLCELPASQLPPRDQRVIDRRDASISAALRILSPPRRPEPAPAPASSDQDAEQMDLFPSA